MTWIVWRRSAAIFSASGCLLVVGTISEKLRPSFANLRANVQPKWVVAFGDVPAPVAFANYATVQGIDHVDSGGRLHTGLSSKAGNFPRWHDETSKENRRLKQAV
jgi:hypothetical protein